MKLRGEVFLTLEAVAHVTGVSLRQVRRYEAEGLVVAAREFDSDGRTRRLYTVSAVRVVRRIRSYEALGVNLAGIDIILRLLEQRARPRR